MTQYEIFKNKVEGANLVDSYKNILLEKAFTLLEGYMITEKQIREFPTLESRLNCLNRLLEIAIAFHLA